MVTDEYRLAFCQATVGLPEDIQRIIWEMSLFTSTCPDAPKKNRIQYGRDNSHKRRGRSL
jgi:hypothetical protein